MVSVFFFFQAEDGIRDDLVTGVQTCALPISVGRELTDRYHCASCHRPDLTCQQQVPRLAGQDFTYLLKLLRGFKVQTAADLDGTMTMAAQPLSEADIENLVHYIAGLTPAPYRASAQPPFERGRG